MTEKVLQIVIIAKTDGCSLTAIYIYQKVKVQLKIYFGIATNPDAGQLEFILKKEINVAS